MTDTQKPWSSEYKPRVYKHMADEKRPRFGDEHCPHTIKVFHSNKCAACGFEPE